MYGATTDTNVYCGETATGKQVKPFITWCTRAALQVIGSVWYINKKAVGATERLLRTVDLWLRKKTEEMAVKRAERDKDTRTADICDVAVALSVAAVVFFTLFAASAPSRAFSGGVGGELLLSVIVYVGVYKLIAWLQKE